MVNFFNKMNKDNLQTYNSSIHDEVLSNISTTELPTENFSEYCKSQLKISKKNNYLQEKFK